MPASEYKIWAWGTPVGDGTTEASHVGVAGVAKCNGTTAPCAVANELICADLARAIRLPCPPGFLVNRDGTPYFVSLNFNLAGEDLPPVNPAEVVAAHPRLSTGVLVFDAWVMNFDRHKRNLAYDRDSKRLQVFDHSHALANGLVNKNADLPPLYGSHCLAGTIDTTDHFSEWFDRIRQVPDFYIIEAADMALQYGYEANDIDDIKTLLLQRRVDIAQIVRDAAEAMPRIKEQLWTLSGEASS